MRKTLVASLLGLLALGGLVMGTVMGQDRLRERPRPGDKRLGEEELIREREEWFIRSRGLDRVARPDRLRGRAVERVTQESALGLGVAAAAPWQSLGPESMTMLNWTMGRVAGRVAALAVHPTDENVIYLGAASGGLWKTTNGGTSWTSLFDAAGTQTIGSIALDPSSPDTVWVGTGEQGQSCTSYFGLGLFRSTDGGLTFAARNGSGTSALALSHVTAVAVSPASSSVVLAGGFDHCQGGTAFVGGLYRSADAGAGWTKVLTGPVNDVVFDPGSPSVVYAAVGRSGATGDGVYRSTDGGVTWTRLTSGIPYGTSIRRLRLAMAPTNSQVLYALVNKSSGTTSLYRTTDGGASWSERNTNACEGQCSYNLCLAVSPATSSTVLVGSIRFFRSTDGGTTLTALTSTWGSSQKVHQDTHVLRYSPGNASRFWVGSDGGLWRTDDGGSNFVNLNANLNVTQYYDIAVHPSDGGRLFGGAQDNSSSARLSGQTWDVTVVTGDGFMNLVDPANTSYVFTTSYPSGGKPSVYRSSSAGSVNSFSRLATTGIGSGETFPWVTPLAIAAAGGPTYVFVGSNYLYRADARQAASSWSWTKISGNLTGGSSALSVITPQWDGGLMTVYAGSSNGRILRTDDALAGSVTWYDVTGNYPGGWVSDVAVDPTDRLRVFATRSAFGAAKLYRSTSGGSTWTAVGSGLSDVPANAVAIDPLNTNRIFVGTDVGVFVSDDGGDTFATFMQGFPQGTVVTDLEIDDAPYTLTAGTYGRGAWQVPLGSGTQPVTVFYDGAESAGTSLTLSSTTSTTVWTRSSTSPSTGAWRWRAGSSTGGNYGDGGDARLTTPALDLGGATSATLSYAYKHSTESGYDFFQVRVSTDGGTTWSNLVSASGQSAGWSGWATHSVDLSSYAGRANVRIQFRLTTDSSVTDWGAAVDEIKVVKQ